MSQAGNGERLPRADFSVQVGPASLTSNREMPRIVPREDATEKIIEVRASVLAKSRNRLSELKRFGPPWNDLYIGAATLCAGGSLSALFSNVELNSSYGKFAYVVLPIIAAVSFTLYFARRYFTSADTNRIVDELLGDLPNPYEEEAR
jgi:hypothetical protein